jgi:putative restriction endonuclease
MGKRDWTKEQLKVAFHLYCQLPFGSLHRGNKEIISLAGAIGRTPSAVAMKLVNFASLDPAITSTGRKGLGNASAADRDIWNEFHADWERLATESGHLLEKFREDAKPVIKADDDEFVLADYSSETRQQIVATRIKQAFFRRAVLSSYKGKCCMTGVTDHRLLLASHIVPWSKDKANRLNPKNGLCLSALHDRAFDKGLISVSPNFKICVSRELKQISTNTFVATSLLALQDQMISLPERFLPDPTFLSWHFETQFLDNIVKAKK